MRTVVGIDDNVGDVLTLLDNLEIANDTAVIFISDNGFFRGEYKLGDKRAAYEESI
ncbi:sulfatase-like hydrolase/transferase [Akkermansiaceae bacterium]|nr:sulfatase-like hydrolase/transferase [Akkermansiaceae bacterium]MDB4419099.1 sulfatase-like hydrolase/transferase [bacterium]